MALQRKNKDSVPSDGIILTEQQALEYQCKLLNNWKISSDVFAFKYGGVFLASATILSGAFINSFYRSKFKLLHYGQISSYLPVCVAPASVSALFHREYILKDVALLKRDVCPVCLQVRASVIQAITGVLLPLLFAPVLNLSLVHRYFTCDVPSIKEPLKVLKFLGEKTKPIKNVLLGITIAQAFVGSFVTYLEAESVYKVTLKLKEVEKKMEDF